MHACFVCLFLPSFSLLLFCHLHFSILIAFRELSVCQNSMAFWEWDQVHLLLHDFLKILSLSAAWYVLCLKVLCRCSWILSVVSLNHPRVSAHSFLDASHHLVTWNLSSPLPFVTCTSSWWCAFNEYSLTFGRENWLFESQISGIFEGKKGTRFSTLFFFQKGEIFKYSNFLLVT